VWKRDSPDWEKILISGSREDRARLEYWLRQLVEVAGERLQHVLAHLGRQLRVERGSRQLRLGLLGRSRSRRGRCLWRLNGRGLRRVTPAPRQRGRDRQRKHGSDGERGESHTSIGTPAYFFLAIVNLDPETPKFHPSPVPAMASDTSPLVSA
jgi:hypothetical protein